MERLYVLYDARCGLCRWSRIWLQSQPKFLDLEFIPADSDQAKAWFPGLAASGSPEELIVVSDEGHVYRESSAWIMCLYALTEYREWSIRLARPSLLPLARRAFSVLSKHRGPISKALRLASDSELADELRKVFEPACTIANQRGVAPRHFAI